MSLSDLTFIVFSCKKSSDHKGLTVYHFALTFVDFGFNLADENMQHVSGRGVHAAFVSIG